MNRLSTLPRGFGSLPALEVLDLTYNNLNQSSLPGNFFYLSEWKHTHSETFARAALAGCWSDLNQWGVCLCSNSSCSLSQWQWLWNHPCWHREAVKAANCKFISGWHQSFYRYVSHFVFVRADLWPSCLSFLFVSFLQLSLRDNDLISLPKEIGELAHLKELHIQGNRLTVLPPELGIYATTSPCFSFLHFHLFSSSTLVQQPYASVSEGTQILGK